MYKFIRSEIIPGLFLLLMGILALMSAYIMEHYFGILPCTLCLYQRLIYLLSTSVALLYIIKPKNFILLAISIGSYLANILVAAYQVLVEKHLVENVISCGSQDFSKLTDQEILELSMSSPTVSCSVPQLVILGISIAGWNVIYCSIVIVIFLYLKKKHEISTH